MIVFLIDPTCPTDSHPQAQVTGLVWRDNDRVISTGHDGIVKIWHVKF